MNPIEIIARNQFEEGWAENKEVIKFNSGQPAIRQPMHDLSSSQEDHTHIKQQQKWSPNNNRYIGGKFFSSSSSNRLSIIKSLEHLQNMCEKTLRPRHLLQLIGCCPHPCAQCRAGGTHNITAVVLLRYEMAPCHSWPRLF